MDMRTEQGRPVRLEDYRPPDWLVESVELDVSLDPTATRVRAALTLRPNGNGAVPAPLMLDGEALTLRALKLDGVALPPEQFVATPDQLTIAQPPQRRFRLEIETVVDPSANTQLLGLYRSGAIYCTQCEAEGFRRITYFPDRPDVMAVYTTRIEAEKADAPVLLANGNLVASGDVPGTTRHFAVWHDPFPKPCYLFALVGGKLAGPRADEIIGILTADTLIKDPAVYKATYANGCNPDGRINVDSVRKDLELYRERGLIEGNVTVEQVIDSSFVDFAVRELGPYKPRR